MECGKKKTFNFKSIVNFNFKPNNSWCEIAFCHASNNTCFIFTICYLIYAIPYYKILKYVWFIILQKSNCVYMYNLCT